MITVSWIIYRLPYPDWCTWRWVLPRLFRYRTLDCRNRKLATADWRFTPELCLHLAFFVLWTSLVASIRKRWNCFDIKDLWNTFWCVNSIHSIDRNRIVPVPESAPSDLRVGLRQDEQERLHRRGSCDTQPRERAKSREFSKINGKNR